MYSGIEKHKFYKIETVNNKEYCGYVIFSNDEMVKLVYETQNTKTFNTKDVDYTFGGKIMLVPQTITIFTNYIVTAQRIYQKHEINKYYTPDNITKFFVPQVLYLSPEQKTHEGSTLFDTIEQCQAKCDELNKIKGWKQEDLTRVEFSNESKEAIKEALRKEKEEEKENDEQN